MKNMEFAKNASERVGRVCSLDSWLVGERTGSSQPVVECPGTIRPGTGKKSGSSELKRKKERDSDLDNTLVEIAKYFGLARVHP